MIEVTIFLQWMEDYFKGWIRPPTKHETWKAKQEFKRQNQIRKQMSKIITAKVKEIHNVKPFNNQHGTIYYNQCLMDNGQKIEIGKKSDVKVGWELSYTIEDDQQEWMKAKAQTKPVDAPQHQNNTPAPQGQVPAAPQPHKPAVNTNDTILYQVALKGSMDYHIASYNPQFGETFTPESINNMALKIAIIAKANIQKL